MKLLNGILLIIFFLTGCTREKNEYPTFTRDIAPIIYSNCTTCHRPNGAGPFPLISYEDVVNRAKQIAQVTSTRYMPPWQPTIGYSDFLGERTLTQSEITILREWVEAQTPIGNSDDLPSLPIFADQWQLGTPDLIVKMETPYILPAEGYDQFRNFVIPIPTDSIHYIEAIDFYSENAQVIHHAVLMFDKSGKARKHDNQDSTIGFDGMFFGEAQGPDGHFLGWTPGKQAIRTPNFAWKLTPKTDLVAQLHMLPSGRPESVKIEVGFYFAENAPTITPTLLRLGRKDINITAGNSAYSLRDTFYLPVDIQIASIYPHAHYLATKMHVYAKSDVGERIWLLHIDPWDFNWQDDYRYKQPVSLKAGSQIFMEYTYDNSSGNPFNFNNPPEQIFYGLQSQDEMGDLTLQVVTKNDNDRLKLKRYYAKKWINQEISGYQMLTKTNPKNFEHQHTLAMLYVQTGEFEKAILHFSHSINANPNYSEARVNFAITLMKNGNFQKAREQLKLALKYTPNYADAHFNLGLMLHNSGNKKIAKHHFGEAARLRPEMEQAIKRQMTRLR